MSFIQRGKFVTSYIREKCEKYIYSAKNNNLVFVLFVFVQINLYFYFDLN